MSVPPKHVCTSGTLYSDHDSLCFQIRRLVAHVEAAQAPVWQRLGKAGGCQAQGQTVNTFRVLNNLLGLIFKILLDFNALFCF